MQQKKPVLLLALLLVCFFTEAQSFVQRKGDQFILNGQPYYYIGANYWYGGLLALNKDEKKGKERLKKELDFLRSKGVTNLRVLAGAEGSGLVNGVTRVGPPLQPKQGEFDAQVLQGLDFLLSEMGKRGMKAVLYLSNNWEWSGGFLQYLNWNGIIPDSIFRRKMNWDELRDEVSQFYTCDGCRKDYQKQVSFLLNHTNSYTHKKYSEEPVIMAWELANEPRPMRPAANKSYCDWIKYIAAFIKKNDRHHLLTLGTEGDIGTEGIEQYEAIHADKNVDYLTIHIWPKNWAWFSDTSILKDMPQVLHNTNEYIQRHEAIAQRLQKPLVIEEFGLPRDQQAFAPSSSTYLRDIYYNNVLDKWQQSKAANGAIAGANFWAFGGTARPIQGQTFWKKGDDLMGDPPMEEQGLNTVFDSDRSTWNLIQNHLKNSPTPTSKINLPSDKNATPQTVALYQNLKKLAAKGIMFGHQDDLAYGVGWRGVSGKSDVKEIVSDYPAVYGWELGNTEHDLPYNLDSVPFDKMQQYIQQGHARGGVITISWHADNPLNEESAWDTTHGAVQAILPGGAKHELYKSWLDKIAFFLQSLKSSRGEAIPVLFRPFHEFTGNWFWWCRNTCNPTEFKLLWRFTVDYLRHEKGLHNLLIVYNTADFTTKEDFLLRYPGDDVVDVVSFDSYQYGDPTTDNAFVESVDHHLSILEEVAAENGKLAALAETGFETIPYSEWWTNTLWKAIGQHHISYVLVWRNAGQQPNGHWHYYVPKKGDVSEADFKKFYSLDKTLFEKDVAKEKLYQ